MSKRAIYADKSSAQLEEFFDSVHDEAKRENALDSASSIKEFTKTISPSRDNIPEAVLRVMDELPANDQGRVFDSVLNGMKLYHREHGKLPTADVIQSALHQGYGAAVGIDAKSKNKRALDSANKALDGIGSTGHSDPISSQPNRAVIAITSAIAEAIPFGTYLPADISSNEAKLVIVSHLAGSLMGSYSPNDLMDGVNVGKSYLSAERRVPITLSSGNTIGDGAISTTTGGSADVQVLRGRAIVLVNGLPVAFENPNVSAGVSNSPISGVVTLASTDYTIGGTITIANGTIALTFSPGLPNGTVVEAEGFIDYEANPSIAPFLLTQAQSFPLYATPWRALVRQTIDSKTQYANEIGVDMQAEALLAVRNQFAMERHFAALAKAKAIGAGNNLRTYDFDSSNQLALKTRAMVWQDFLATLGQSDQQMAEDTMDHGITHLYVGKLIVAQLLSMGRDLFVPSGIVARPGVYWVGTLYGRFEVYYTPRLITESSTATEIIAVGRSTQVARCPIVLGDAVAPTYEQLAVGDDLRFGNGFYARNFTSVNPHQPSAKGAALFSVTNVF